jgi:energy-coupling factor transport system permease protein
MIVISILIFLEHKNLIFISTLAFIPSILLFSCKRYKMVSIYGLLFLVTIFLRVLQTRVELPYLCYTFGGMIVWLVLRLFPSFILAYYIIDSTKTSEFVAAMQAWHIPDVFIIPVSVVLRFIPTIQSESQSISYAMKMRGIQFASKNFWKNPGLLIEYRMIPVIMSVAKIGEELSAAALTKGLGKYNDRSSIVELSFGKNDFFMFIVCMVLCAWVVVL